MSQNHLKTISTTIVVLATMAFIGYFLNRIFDAPGRIIQTSFEVVDKGTQAIKKLAAAVNTQTIKTEYTSTATTLAGASRLQVATINQVELFERLDTSTLIGFSLPDVIVNAKAPIEYTFFLDLHGEWEFSWDEKTMTVIAPAIQFNTPAIDSSAVEYQVIKGSLFRDISAAKESLRKPMSVRWPLVRLICGIARLNYNITP